MYGIRVRTPRLELRLGDTAELRQLAALAERGIHPPDEMPFAIAWTDAIGEPGFADGFLEYHHTSLRDWAPERWTLNLLVWEAGTLVGTQGVMADRFAADRTVETGSWLGRAHQGRGLGTEMRAAAIELAIRGLGATTVTSAWLEGNHASRRVSEKLGYRVVGRGEPRAAGRRDRPRVGSATRRRRLAVTRRGDARRADRMPPALRAGERLTHI